MNMDSTVTGTAALHPLEPLTADEVQAAVRIVKADARVTGSFRFVSVVLHEPPKQAVLAHRDGDESVRQAFVIVGLTLRRPCPPRLAALLSLIPSPHSAVSAILGTWQRIPPGRHRPAPLRHSNH